MNQYSLSELIQLSDIIKSEKTLSSRYQQCSLAASDPALREKLEKCAATHKNHYSLLISYIDKQGE